MISPPHELLVEIAAKLLAAPDAASRASIIASSIVEQLSDCACAVHRFALAVDPVDGVWTVVAVAGPISVELMSIEPGNRLVDPLLSESPGAVVYPGSDIRREDYSHLRVSRSVESIAYLPLLRDSQLVGAIEILAFSSILNAQNLENLAPVLDLATPAILAAEDAELQRQDLMDSVHRMSQLYDLEKSLNSTLEFDTVVASIPGKVAAMLPCQAIHLWLFDGAELRLSSTYGADATVEDGWTQSPGEGYVADMAEEGANLLIDNPEDERLIFRNATADEDSGIPLITNALLVPLMQDDAEVGVLEAVNREGRPFDEDDEFLLVSMAETVSSALKNASLLLAERKLEILKTLVRVSSEITSTLRLDRLLQIIVNSPQNVLPYERSAIALDNRGRLQLKAVSGMTSLPLGDVVVERMHRLMRWLSSQDELMHFRRNVEADSSDTDELPETIALYFDETGCRGLFVLPLKDDQGRVGLLMYESSQPDFLDIPHTEMIKVLAGQATVAIRNALLYREVPLISLIEPLVRRKNALLGTGRNRRLTYAAILLEAVLFLVFCPLPMRVTGEALVAPQHLVTITAPVDGNVTAVYTHEGSLVHAGDTLGAMNDWQWRTDLAASEAKYEEANLVMQNDLAHGSPQAGADRAQAEFLRSEVARAKSRFESAQLRSPMDGIVITPNLQNVAGQHLDAGATFAQVLDISSAVVQIAIPEEDASLMRAGQPAAIKLDSYPQRTWHARVSVVGPEAQPTDGQRFFIAEVPLSNPDASLRTGMTGRAKISIGWRPAGYVLLRRPALWIWQAMWNWIGW